MPRSLAGASERSRTCRTLGDGPWLRLACGAQSLRSLRSPARREREGQPRAGCDGLRRSIARAKRSLRVATDTEPKFRRVIGKGHRVTSDQVSVARGGAGAPHAGFVYLSGSTQDAGEPRGIVGIIGGDRQRPQPSDCRISIAEGGVGLSEMPLGWCISWHRCAAAANQPRARWGSSRPSHIRPR